jgi:hypothetical protein
LEREEAVKFLKIFSDIHRENDSFNSINIICLNQTNDLCNSYQISIKGINIHTMKDLESLLGKYGLTAREDKDAIIVYKPIK